MNLSKYQTDILDWAEHGSGNAVVQAKAGSGKTFTLVQLLKVCQGKVIVLAFNKHIADEMRQKVPQHVTVQTTNAFGNMIVRSSLKGVKFDQYKTWNLLQPLLNQRDYLRCRNQVQRVVSLMKASYPNPNAQDLMDKHDIIFPSDLKDDPIQLCTKVYELCVKTDTLMDFDDQIFYPVAKDLPIYPWDWVLVDEAQDLNPVQLALIKKMIGKNGRLVAVGDSYQSIYGFRGADPESINNIIQVFNAKTLPLSICYRCPKSVVREAQKIVPDIEYTETAEEGSVTRVNIKEWKPEVGDLVLCRTTAPLVSECLRMIRGGSKATVKGRDIGEGLIKLYHEICPPHSVEQDQRAMLNQYRIQRLNALKDKPESIKIAVNDQIDTLEAVLDFIEENQNASNTNNALDSVPKCIESIFSDTQGGVLFCTIHRAKGLEFRKVHIIRPELLPHPKCTVGWQLQQEHNLKYVGITRAMCELVWVDGERKQQ